VRPHERQLRAPGQQEELVGAGGHGSIVRRCPPPRAWQ
jgi:hypothetical protein